MLKTTYKPSAPLPPGWTEHTAASGHKYYYNASTKQSTYRRPQPVQVTEQKDEELQIDYNATAPDASLHATAQALDEFYRNADPRKWQQNQKQNQKQNQHRGQQPDRSRRGHGGDRPKSKKPIPGADPWVLVTTKFGRRFVHNTETKQSLWRFPQDVMMAVIDLDRAEWERKQKEKEKDGEKDTQTKADDGSNSEGKPSIAVQTEGDDEGSSSEYEEVEVTDNEDEEEAEGGSKRPRLDEDKAQEDPNTGPFEMKEDDIEWQLAQLEAQEGSDENYNDYHDSYEQYDEKDDDNSNNNNNNDEDGLPLTAEDNIALFRSLLEDFGISPYWTFDKVTENVDMVEDRRYVALPNMRARRDVFTEWAKEKVSAIKEAKASEDNKADEEKNNDPTIKYLTFLHQFATPKLYWPEFKRKYRKQSVMKGYDLSDKDRERLYRDLTSKLKRSEAERRKELLALLKQHPPPPLGSSSLPNRAMLKDVRYYILDTKKRDEIVDGFSRT